MDVCSMVKACSLTKPPVCRNSEGHGSTTRYTPSALIGYRDIQWKNVNPNLVQDYSLSFEALVVYISTDHTRTVKTCLIIQFFF
jgi:hypothetical protein